MTPPRWPADGTLRLSFGVELAHEPGHTPRDLVARPADGVDRLSLRVRQVPVQIAPAGYEWALVAAAHGHHHVRPLRHLRRELHGLPVLEVDAHLAHHLDDLGMDVLRRVRSCGPRLVSPAYRALEEGLAHLRAPGVVEADEEHVRHLVALPPDQLVRERTEGRPRAWRRDVDPQVVPVPRGERRTERPSGIHRRTGDRAAEDRVEPHGAADRDR